MLKQIQSGFSRFPIKKWIPIIILLVICFVLVGYSSYKGTVLDRMTNGSASWGGAQAPTVNSTGMAGSPPVLSMPDVPAKVNSPDMMAPSASASASANNSNYKMNPVANPSELLPKDQNSQWAALNPVGGNVPVPDLLQAGYHVGLDTIGQTLKNPNYQLRSDPIIEKKDIGPWMQSTIEPDYGRIPLEVGYGTR